MAADTICAVASAPGSALRGVLRLSGPAAWAIVERVTGTALPRTRGSQAARIQDPEGGIPAQVLRMPGPASFTREDVLELHVPGNEFLVQEVLAGLLAAGARLAQPGEFIRRAFEHGRLDLTRVEGVLALIEAQDKTERRAASALLFGGLQRRIDGLRAELERLRALCEASLDFDEADTGHVPSEELQAMLAALLHDLAEALAWETRREAAPGAALVVLAGAPNAGKSSLFNALVGPESLGSNPSKATSAGVTGTETTSTGTTVDRSTSAGATSAGSTSASSVPPALVENQPGSTRDVLRAAWRLGERVALLADTAGRWVDRAPEALGDVDRQAQAKAEHEWQRADCLLWVADAGHPVWPDGELAARALLVWNQIDREGVPPEPPLAQRAKFGLGWVATSAARGDGLDSLAEQVLERLQGEASAADWTRSLGLRHRQALEAAQEQVLLAQGGIEAGVPLDLVAEDLRLATQALDEISGHTTPEDLLSRIFAQFCLGK
ncbi:MAG: 50S ribosome-binding GTPase [Planctomycetes bacterium]|nr:50S ribosome-binding GTPase [Planctomycetota bacterium]